jgi:hypothetical protein
LEEALEEGVIIFDNYFAVCATDLSCLVSLPTEDGGLYHIVADVSFALEDGTQIVSATTTMATIPTFEAITLRKLCLSSSVLTALDSVETIDCSP